MCAEGSSVQAERKSTIEMVILIQPTSDIHFDPVDPMSNHCTGLINKIAVKQ